MKCVLVPSVSGRHECQSLNPRAVRDSSRLLGPQQLGLVVISHVLRHLCSLQHLPFLCNKPK